MAKILLGINTLTEISQPVYANHMQFFYNLGRRTTHDVCLYTPNRMGIDKMRNTAAKVAMDNGFEYLLFLDDDVIVPIDSLDRMVAAKKDIIAGHTIIRGYPFKNMFFKKDKEGLLVNYQDYEKDLPDDQMLPVDAVGFSYCLINLELCKKVPPPWFITGAYNTEDIYFCVKARHHVPDCSIFVHIGVPTMHKVGYEFIGPGNLESYKSYCEEVYPFMKNDPPKEGDLGDGEATTKVDLGAADKRDSNAGDESNLIGIEQVIFEDVWGKGTGIVPVPVKDIELKIGDSMPFEDKVEA